MTNSISDDAFDLFELNYRFAIQRVDPRVGEVVAWQAYTPQDARVPIELVDCLEFSEDETWSALTSDGGLTSRLLNDH